MPQSATLPKFIQLSEMLIRDIAAGRLADGARLPPEREMAESLGVAVGTLRKSLADLEAKGMLERVHGSGNYVRHKTAVDSVYAFFRLELLQGGGLPSAEVLSVDRLPKPPAFAALGGDAEGHRIRRLRALDGVWVALEEVWLDGALRATIRKEELSESLYLYYRQALNLVIARVEDKVGVDVLPDWSPACLLMEPGQVTGAVERFSQDPDQRPQEYSLTWFDPARAKYISRMGRG